MSEAVRQVVIAGGGLAGWYCAARLCHAMRGRKLSVHVVRAAPRGEPVDPLDVFCASTLSALPVAHAELGIDERAFMRGCDATFKLATEYRGFDDATEGYLLPFGEIGARIEAVGFHQFVSRLVQGGRRISLDDFAVPSIAARRARFAHPSPDARSVLSTYEYAYHLDTQAYPRMLRAFAESLGAVAVEEEVAHCEVAGESIRALTLGNGTRIEADFFIDCTGARATLLGGALGVPLESWRAWLPCDTALVARLPPPAELPPYTRALALPGGWCWQAPLRSGTESAVFYDSRATKKEDALAQAAATLRMPMPQTRELEFENGARRAAWRGNCVAMGPAACVLEPLAGAGLRIIDAEIGKLVELFPERGDMTRLAAEYNRVVGMHHDRARDFTLLHYLLSRRPEPFWGARAAPPAVLGRAIDLFRRRGRLAFEEEETFEDGWWACACIGLGVRPGRFSVLAEQLSEADILTRFEKITKHMHAAVEQLPPHRLYLQKYLA